jgi:uncharacterized protein
LWMSAEQVARTGLDDVIAGRALSVPGLMYKTMVTASGLAPRGLVRRISSLVQRSRPPANEE